MAKLYTKTGDKGLTSLLGGQRVSKSHLRVEAYGQVDELNSVIGLARSHIARLRNQNNLAPYCQDLDEWLSGIQHQLFHLGSHLACTGAKQRAQLPNFEDSWVSKMEQLMDQFDSQLPQLTAFILPGGSHTASHLHLARTVCRRAERTVLKALGKDSSSLKYIRYLNRLSDLLFAMARYANKHEGIEDVLWKQHETDQGHSRGQ
jgi:cob(I)alamin adenosyltransferase